MATATFTVTRSAVVSGTTTVNWATSNRASAIVGDTAIVAGTEGVQFAYTGVEELWTVPQGVTSVTVDMAGAAGGLTGLGTPTTVPKGGRVQATLTTTPGEILRIGVAGAGTNGGIGTTGVGGIGGFYAGANGATSTGGGNGGGGGGGGQSYIKRGGTADSNRVLVAGGGGGSGNGQAGTDGGSTLSTEATTASAATVGTVDGSSNAGGGGGGGWVGGIGGIQFGDGGSNMRHSTQTSGVTSTSGFQAGNGYVNITYTNPNDYTAASGTVTFLTTDTTKTFNVTVTNNGYSEPDRTFLVTLSSAVNGSIADNQAVCTIQDDEAGKTFLQDFSGNGKDLTAGSTATTNRASSVVKFGNGRDFGDSVANARLTRTDSGFNLTGDFSATVVFDADTIATGALTQRGLAGYSDNDGAPGGGPWSLYLHNDTGDASPTVAFFQKGTTPTTFLGNVTTGYHTVTLRRDSVAKTIVMKVDGTVVVNATYTGSITSGGIRLSVGGRGDGNAGNALDGAIYDLRIWDHLVNQSVLDAIVASSGKCKPEGSELAFYRMEDT